jgi:hypothetical protein
MITDRSLITRFASIGTICSLVLAGSSATTWAQLASPSLSVHIHKGAVAGFYAANTVLVKITALCTGGITGLVSGSVHVQVDQSADQSTGNQDTSGMADYPVKCNGQPQTIAADVGFDTNVPGFNLGSATASVTLFAPSGVISSVRTIVIGFPVIEGMEEEQGGNE